ncbi:hypothetical protein QBZ16_003331 [Prototheca wickerhamii]|uniref:Sm domain-containing protein n=1 Tax=Prototheca wickerhamii TaxID=3111 RepID=A0AAD9IIS9_PROWI|nr:hypothetical protein QBZ16_003331 [Prototheca wickerhamii]
MSKPGPKKDNALDIAKLIDKVGTLKGYDQLLNLVLDETIEYLRDPEDPMRTTEQTRPLGLVVCRGTSVTLVAPSLGSEEIANPFLGGDDA